jgi:hypothetical protein
VFDGEIQGELELKVLRNRRPASIAKTQNVERRTLNACRKSLVEGDSFLRLGGLVANVFVEEVGAEG